MFSSHPYSSPLRTYRREKAPRENEQILLPHRLEIRDSVRDRNIP